MDHRLKKLVDVDILFMGEHWVRDLTATEKPLPGWRHVGQIPCVSANDLFYWATADAIEVPDEKADDLMKAIKDCEGDPVWGPSLFACREYKMRPQGAMYKHIPKKFWPLFNACGPKRDSGRDSFANPYPQPEE